MHGHITGPVLYLDYDGVLHPDDVYRIRGEIVLRCDGIRLFEWTPLLEDCLSPYPEVQVVLSTSWVRVLSFDDARARLPEKLAMRVIGATWHSSMKRWWHGLSRYEQILQHRKRHNVTEWIAIDDDLQGWPENDREQLVPTDSSLGIAAPHTEALLRQKLAVLCAPPDGQGTIKR